MNEILTVGVAGCGTMGAGIAIVCARAGFRTIVYDTRADAPRAPLSGWVRATTV